MKKILIIFSLILCCAMTACSANQAKTQETMSQPSASAKSTDKPTQHSTAALTTEKQTESPTDAPTEKATEPPTEAPKDTTWKQLYIDYLNTLDRSLYSGYQLIYIDDDDIPELAVCGNSHVVPSYLCWINNGKLCQGNMSFSGFAYLERQNKYICEEGFTGSGWDYVRRINGDEAEDLIKGELCTIQGQEFYRWDGVDYPNQEQYEAAKNADFDKRSAQTTDNVKSYTEICSQISKY